MQIAIPVLVALLFWSVLVQQRRAGFQDGQKSLLAEMQRLERVAENAQGVAKDAQGAAKSALEAAEHWKSNSDQFEKIAQTNLETIHAYESLLGR